MPPFLITTSNQTCPASSSPVLWLLRVWAHSCASLRAHTSRLPASYADSVARGQTDLGPFPTLIMLDKKSRLPVSRVASLKQRKEFNVVMHAYVINLARSPDRRAHIVAELQRTGLTYEMIPAVDGRTLDLDDKTLIDPLLASRSPFVAGAAGCAEPLLHLSEDHRGRPRSSADIWRMTSDCRPTWVIWPMK